MNTNRFSTNLNDASHLVQHYKQLNRVTNTDASTKTWVKIYNEWRAAHGITKQIYEYTNTATLNEHLELFYAQLRKKDNDEYETKCMNVMYSALQREITEKQAPYNIMRDDAFQSSRAVLNGKVKAMMAAGKGKRPNAAQPLTQSEIDYLWSIGRFGDANPRALLYTVWWMTNMQFGGRGREGNFQMFCALFNINPSQKRYAHSIIIFYKEIRPILALNLSIF